MKILYKNVFLEIYVDRKPLSKFHGVTGSCESLAQSVEHLPFKERVQGSSP